jgi:hypothetical protein
MLKATENDAQVKIDVSPERLDAFFDACIFHDASKIEGDLKEIFPEETSVGDLVKFHNQHQQDQEQFFCAIFEPGTNVMAQYFVLERFFQGRPLPVNEGLDINYLDLISKARQFAGFAAAFIYFDYLPEYRCVNFSPYEDPTSKYPLKTQGGVICHDLKGELGKRRIDEVTRKIKLFISKKISLEAELKSAEVGHDILGQLDCQMALVTHWMSLADKDRQDDRVYGTSFSCWKASFHMLQMTSLLNFILKTRPNLAPASLQTCQKHAEKLSEYVDRIKKDPNDYCVFGRALTYPEIEQSALNLKAWFESSKVRRDESLKAQIMRNRKINPKGSDEISLRRVLGSAVTFYRVCFGPTETPPPDSKKEKGAEANTNPEPSPSAAYSSTRQMCRLR